MKLQEFYNLLCVIYAKQIHIAEEYKHLYDYIYQEQIKGYEAIEDIFISISIAEIIERAIYKNLPKLIHYHEERHNKLKEQGINTRKESTKYRFFYNQVNFMICIAQNNCKKCKSFNICPLMKKKNRKLKINIKELEKAI